MRRNSALKFKILALAATACALTACSQVQEYQFRSAARASFDDVLSDAESARFRKERIVWSSTEKNQLALCGEVNAKNLLGAYVGWKRFVVVGHASPASTPGPLIEDSSYLQGKFKEQGRLYCGWR
ncbi:hypothetical protein [Stenotrophomonas sp. SMYL86]|uniref:hypothetical protein n=1 Tax=Stenotrophomonas sp. SMYL86 TaxID=3076044 RepID=UPI002E75B5FD|nr:hypothetical protein [Stenotrophomonas sp. SMYL86]